MLNCCKIVLHHAVVISLIIFIISIFSCNQKDDPKIENILVITGGHEFEPSFFKIFDSFVDIAYDTISQPGFNQIIHFGLKNHYKALVFYDMWQEINEEQKKAYLKMLDNGQGMVFLHHSLVSYQQWDEFIKIVGGKYVERRFNDDLTLKGSTYTEDITLDIKVVDRNHPVTHDITDFSIYDEGYQFIEMLPTITPLLRTVHPDCTPTVAWAHTYKNSRIVYILLGHGHQAHEADSYRKLVRNAINWVGEGK